jgi:hypothetical protein
MQKLILLCCIHICFYSCIENDYNPALLKPEATKKLGEILVVTKKENWDNIIGQTLLANYSQLINTTPLPYEKEFNLEFIDPDGLIQNIKKHNCIFIIDFNDGYEESSTIPPPISDLWAKNQMVLDFKFKNKNAAVNLFKNKKKEIKQLINGFYYAKINKKFTTNKTINSLLKKKYNFHLKLPSNMKVNKSNIDITWLSQLTIEKDQNGKHEIQQGLIIYEYDYENQLQFSLEHQILFRDSIYKNHILGKTEDTFMEARKDNLGNFSENAFMNNKSEYIFEIAGLWRVANDKMGGPFVSISRLNPRQTKIITIEGYVYAPNFEKGDLLRELKSMIYSLEWNYSQ